MARPRSSAPSSSPAAPSPAPEAPKEKSASSFMMLIWGIPILVIALSVIIRRSCMG
jgi:hypothetical protein